MRGNLNLEITLVRYSNPTHESCDGEHCEDLVGAFITDQCDNYFTFQLRTQGSSTLLSPKITTSDYQKDVFSFDASVLAALGIPKPLTFHNLNPIVRGRQS